MCIRSEYAKIVAIFVLFMFLMDYFNFFPEVINLKNTKKKNTDTEEKEIGKGRLGEIYLDMVNAEWDIL
jgi:hypothetical protein